MTMDTKQLIETYHAAWTSGDFATARRCLADDLDFRGSIDSFDKADDFVAALTQFRGMLRGVTVLMSCVDGEGAALLYDCDTPTPAGVIRTAEFFRTRNGKIVEIRLVFDAAALRAMMHR
jgi:ketosteroid isomerase-like protein